MKVDGEIEICPFVLKLSGYFAVSKKYPISINCLNTKQIYGTLRGVFDFQLIGIYRKDI
jgi:hypothetical protein